MKPTPEEKQWLRDYLYQTMQYRETFEEVYDHILLALESESRPQFFESSVLKVIADDFDSNNGIYELEQSCKSAAERDAVHHYFTFMKMWLNAKHILFTALIFALLCLLGLKFPVALIMLFVNFFLVMPVVFFLVRKVIVYFQREYGKPSLKDEILKQLTFKLTGLIWFLGCLANWMNKIIEFAGHTTVVLPPAQRHHPIQLGPGIVVNGLILAGFITWMALHFLAIVKLYRREFKSNMMTTN